MPTIDELREKPHWSYSSLNTYLNICSLKWFFRYREELEPETVSVNRLFGKAFHAAAETLALARQDGDCGTEMRAEEFFTEHWNLECRSAENLVLERNEWDELNRKGRQMTACLRAGWTEEKVVAVSRAFSVEIPGLGKPVIGEFDLVAEDSDGCTVIVDWKTSGRKWPADKAAKDLQATVYAYAGEKQCGYIPEVRFDVITKTKTPSFTQYPAERTQDDFRRLEKIAAGVENACMKDVFLPAEQSFFCGSCEYAGACRNWHLANAA